jgi:biopolymer transport protein ExbD
MFGKNREVNFVREEPQEEHRLQMAPLIDVVFLLICFYLFVAQLITSQKDSAVHLAEMGSPMAAREIPAEVTINLRHDGTITMGGHPVTLNAVGAILQESLDRNGDTGRRVRVVVRADHRQRFGRLDEVLEMCRKCGVDRVVFRARREGT